MSEFFKTLTNPRGKYGYWGVGVVVLFGIALLVMPGLFLGKSKPLSQAPNLVLEKTDPKQAPYPLSTVESALAQQVSQILCQVEGAGKVTVSVSLTAGPAHDYARNTTDSKSTIEEKDTGGGTRTTTEMNQKAELVFAQGKGEPVIVKELGPQIKGIVVVAEGAKDVEIRSKLSRAVQSMLDLPAHRVMVLPKESR
ncbi:hypothetical protein BR63_03880 [Thermanaerosceptrum fracticalcis]|uniref:Stage III sporulation protein AG n=1 Tax=Thermanaerosceptrum fracticalcis TaxID=1712410 RepID=A0A7G6E0C6_THEFR|nr:hypothetical protein [Thermanaerosceptrum fracticalcis]QNB45530.1 hypothetical protein BR63_03880 [Thermanaerosceptrum fracticalcis]